MTQYYRLLQAVLLALASSQVLASGLPADCGQRKHMYTNLIVKGKEAKAGNWPWHTAIFHRVDSVFEYKCGGTIIDKNTILTAAHCVRLSNGIIPSEKLSIQVGRNQLLVADDRAAEHAASRILVDKRYQSGAVDHDIALIKLATDIQFTDYIQPVCLWNRGEDRLLIREREGTIVGFGATATSGFSEVLNEAQLPVVDNQICLESNREIFARTLTNNMYCAGRRNGVNACNGDSGGGMFFLIGEHWFVRGIVSFSPVVESTGACDPQEYVVFTDVARYVDWIAHQLNASFVEAPARSDVHPKLKLLKQDICGTNTYPFHKETEKPVFLTYPWVGLIEYTKQGGTETKTLCHAILISDRYLVTAAQCVYNTKNYKPTSIRLGDYDTSTDQDCDQLDGTVVCADPIQTLPIETITVHQQYNKPRYANDIALIRLRRRADITPENVRPVCLPLSKALRSHKPPTFTRTGWKGSNSQTTMQRSQVNVVESVACQRLYNANRVRLEKTFRQICVERDPVPASGTCVFDRAAAPLQSVQTVDASPRYVLHGILTLGPNKCHLNYPDVYTNIGTYLEWILDNLQE
ncbi:CLIP domain-containing serine protease B15-like [Toxorhynchites rutilus septentrionalis]|uniref:CLIP domain-containing serine protease B15-like n=1 Tax=Toxorhynchites rutilus septentrionalis TaxID=329112 RepID=UPI00247A5E24|nr:CLIP domain-containing serine protease B15-like [Toxorhynchites rutilus septentrionalis]